MVFSIPDGTTQHPIVFHLNLLLSKVEEVCHLTKSYIKSSPILLQLRDSGSATLAIKRTIKKMCQEGIQVKTPIEVLLGFLKQIYWVWDVTFNTSEEIQQVFFYHCLNQPPCGSPQLNFQKKHVQASPPPCNWPDLKQKQILDWLLFPDYTRFISQTVTQCSNKCFSGLQGSSLKNFYPADSKSWEKFMKFWNSTTHSKTMASFEERYSELKHLLSRWLAVQEYLKNSILHVKEPFFIFISNSSENLLSLCKSLLHVVRGT
ncbi:uncharacterized protein VP01_333g7 [Puccinia sorghi]|uniref:Uncharacterized protein n=1 Tax=Puccinia sorghi TaxID=27349 RepID=A0A0L6UX29_9BASI|nr:uncharacterized protein VP01_333g7 [Puccinia sorghi]